MKPLLSSSVAIFIHNIGCLFLTDLIQCFKKIIVQFSNPSTIKHITSYIDKPSTIKKVPFCKLITHNWHRIPFSLVQFIKVMKIGK